MSDYVQAGYLGKVVLHESCFPETKNPQIGDSGAICSDGCTIQTNTGLQFPKYYSFFLLVIVLLNSLELSIQFQIFLLYLVWVQVSSTFKNEKYMYL